MFQRNGKFVLTLSLLLMLSQWLSLAHATEHMVESNDGYCQVCTLQHQFHSATVNSLTCITATAKNSYTHIFDKHFFTTAPDSTRAIRAPPL